MQLRTILQRSERSNCYLKNEKEVFNKGVYNKLNETVNEAGNDADRFLISALETEKSTTSKIIKKNKDLKNRNLLSIQKSEFVIANLKSKHLLAAVELE